MTALPLATVVTVLSGLGSEAGFVNALLPRYQSTSTHPARSGRRSSGETPEAPAPHALFDDRLAEPNQADHTAYAVDRDGRLLAFEAPERPPLRHLRVVLDWMEAAGLSP